MCRPVLFGGEGKKVKVASAPAAPCRKSGPPPRGRRPANDGTNLLLVIQERAQPHTQRPAQCGKRVDGMRAPDSIWRTCS